MNFRLNLLLLALLFSLTPNWAQAELDYHLVGWFNTFVPGGGQFLLGKPFYGIYQATLEIGTFYSGYKMSARSPMTLDGVPESLPSPATTSQVLKKITNSYNCILWNSARTRCISWKNGTSISSSAISPSHDIMRELYADWLQEFGLKYHMVNVFDSYRTVAGENSVYQGQRIDPSAPAELFLAPFKWENLSDPAVYAGLAVTAALVIYNYNLLINTPGGIAPTGRLNSRSSSLYNFTYLGLYPVGSAAPEEMFYRGFLQHELHVMTGTPWLAIPLSTAAFAFSHSAEERPSAALSGLFLGLLTYFRGGYLSSPIAYHFWSDVISGLYQISVVKKSSGERPILNLSFRF